MDSKWACCVRHCSGSYDSQFVNKFLTFPPTMLIPNDLFSTRSRITSRSRPHDASSNDVVFTKSGRWKHSVKFLNVPWQDVWQTKVKRREIIFRYWSNIQTWFVIFWFSYFLHLFLSSSCSPFKSRRMSTIKLNYFASCMKKWCIAL